MDFTIWITSATVLGVILGYLGYLYSKLAYSIFTISAFTLLFFANYVIQITGGDLAGAINVEPSTSILAIGPFGKIISGVNKMNFLPHHVQVAILVFTVTFFITRILTWAFKSFGPKKAEEIQAQRRARVLKTYGMKSMSDVRNLR